jgi:hypothetical protein
MIKFIVTLFFYHTFAKRERFKILSGEKLYWYTKHDLNLDTYVYGGVNLGAVFEQDPKEEIRLRLFYESEYNKTIYHKRFNTSFNQLLSWVNVKQEMRIEVSDVYENIVITLILDEVKKYSPLYYLMYSTIIAMIIFVFCLFSFECVSIMITCVRCIKKKKKKEKEQIFYSNDATTTDDSKVANYDEVV